MYPGFRKRKADVSLLMPVLDVCLAMTIITLSPGALLYVQHRQVLCSDTARPVVSQQQIDRLRAQQEELRRQYEQLLTQLHKKPPVDPQPSGKLPDLQRNQQDLNSSIEALRQEIARLRNLLETSQPTDTQTQKRLQELRQLLKDLQNKIAQAQEELKQLQYTREQLEKMKQLQQEIEKLQKEFQQAQQEWNHLQEQIARLEAELRRMRENAEIIKVHPRIKYPENMTPKGLIIYKAKLTPITAPYYQRVEEEKELIPGLRIRMPILRFVREGPPASEALQPGSDFYEWLDQIDPKKEYVFMYVCPDSFQTFAAVREELRRRNILCGWQPDEVGNEDIYPRFAPGPPPPIQ